MSTDHSYPVFPPTDPTPIFELFRGGYGADLLVASSAHFNVFDRLANEPQTETVLGQALGLERRPSLVLFTALRAMDLLRVNATGKLELTDLVLPVQFLIRGIHGSHVQHLKYILLYIHLVL